MNDANEARMPPPQRHSGVHAGCRRTSGHWTIGIAVLLLWLLAAPVWAQSAVDGFDPNVSAAVSVVAVQPDGKVLVTGDFMQVGGQTRRYLARLNANGTLDAGFDPNAFGIVRSVAVQPDGKVLVGGSFTQIGGQTRRYLARLNADGTLDAGFNPDANDIVLSLAPQPDGKVLVGGYFTQIGGQVRNRIARLNADGTLDASFNPDADNSVSSLAVQADGKVLVGGNFAQIGGQARNRIARLNTDGMADTGFNPDANDSVSSLAVQPDGKVLVGGYFKQIGGQTRNYLARLNANGTLDAGFNPEVNFIVSSLAVQPDGKVLIGGAFTQIGGQARNRIARLNANGTLEAGFNPGANNKIASIAVQPDGKVLVGGDFTQIGAQARNYLARLNADGTLEAGFNPDSTGLVYSLAVQPDGKVLVGGSFTQLGGQTRNHLARLNADGTLDAGFNPDADGAVQSLAVQPDGKVLVGGNFSQIEGQARNRIARLNANGTLDASFNPNANIMVLGLALQPDGKVLVSGGFTQIGGQARKYLARLNADGTLDAGFNPNANSTVWSVAVQPGSKVLVGGSFTQIGGQARNYLARLNADGTLDFGFDPNANNNVYSLTLQPDGKVLVGGAFTQIGGQTRNYLARLNADGTLEAGFNPTANERVFSLAVQSDGKVLIGGVFTQMSGQTRNRIARLNADGTLDAGFNPNANNDVYSLAVQPDGKVLVGGAFAQIGGQARNHIARLSASEAALQSLDAGQDRSSVTWRRDGSGPELTQVGFERSDDGSAWSPLGAATRVAGGWSLGGLNLPRNRNVWLRARGYASGGQYNGSSSLIESVRMAYLAIPIVTITVSGQGQATPPTQDVEPGQNAAFSVTATPGWKLDTVSGDTCTPLDQGNGQWRVVNVQTNCAIAVAFAANPPPVATPQNVSVVFNTARAITLAGSDPNPGGPFAFTYAIATQPAHGAISGFDTTTGTLTYTPTLGYSGSDNFAFTLKTVNGTSTPTAVSLTIAAGQPVQATAQSVSVAFNTGKAITLTGSDPNPGSPFAFTYAIANPPGHGVIGGFDAATGALLYTPMLGYSGSDSFTFTATTMNGTSAAATVSLTIATGQPVQATPQSVNVVFNTARAIVLAGNDPNPGGPFAFTYALVAQPTHGTISDFDAATGALTYAPNSGYSGSDSFTFATQTVNGTSIAATVSLTIAQGAAVVATPQSANVPYNTAKAITLVGNDPNPGGPFVLTYDLVAQPSHGAISDFDASSGALTYTPTIGYSGSDSFTFTAKTVNGTSVAAKVSLTIAEGQPVTATPQSVDVPLNTTAAITLKGSDPNPGGPFAFTYAIVAQPSRGTISGFNANTGALIYAPNANVVGTDSFTFTVSSPNGTSLPATVRLTIVTPQLTLSIDDRREYAHYGEVVDYVVTLTNPGDTANAVPVTFALSQGFDGDNAQFACYGANGGASCTPDAMNPLRYTVTLPPNRTLTWFVSVRVRSDAEDDEIAFSVHAIGAKPATDIDTLVIFRDGLDPQDAGGMQEVP